MQDGYLHKTNLNTPICKNLPENFVFCSILKIFITQETRNLNKHMLRCLVITQMAITSVGTYDELAFHEVRVRQCSFQAHRKRRDCGVSGGSS